MKDIRVVAAIVKKDGKILIAQRKKGQFKGQWEFPGGKVEENESFEDAIRREIFEELAVEINVDSYFMKVCHSYDTFKIEMHCFICTIIKGNIKLQEHMDMKWISVNDDIDDIDWITADIQVVEQLKVIENSVR